MILKLDQVSKNYQQAETIIHAVDNVSFSVERGDSVSIVGPSGSGKTTLLSLMTGLDKPTQGEIFVEGADIVAMKEKDLAHYRAQNIGIVFQQFHLMSHLSALENVQLPLEILKIENVQERAEEALARVGLANRRNHLPDELSGGEKQRVAIARATVAEPKILFADEPSGNLDQKTGEKVVELLFDQVEKLKTTLLLVTHDLELAKRCRQQLSMSGGKLK